MGIILFITARILQWILSPLFIVYSIVRLGSYKAISKYFRDMAITIDKLGNVMGGSIMNDVLIMKDGYKFGDKSKTISYVLGMNYPLTLTWFGFALAMLLNKLDPNHVEKAVESAE